MIKLSSYIILLSIFLMADAASMSVLDLGCNSSEIKKNIQSSSLRITCESDYINVFINSHYSIKISKKDFTITARNNKKKSIKSINSTINLNGTDYAVSAPSEFYTGSNWVELRGWFSQAQNLWYVARYRFWPNTPYIHLSMSVMDRHNDHPTEAHWASLWDNRVIKDLKINIDTGKALAPAIISQQNAYSSGTPGTSPVLQEETANGTVHWEQRIIDNNTIQLIHAFDNSGNTFVRVFPMHTGTVDLSLNQSPLSSPYPAANNVTVNIHHANGDSVVMVDQGQSLNQLGSFTLNNDSYIEINATGESGDRVVFEQLTLSNGSTPVKTVTANRASDNLFDTNQYGLVVKDFWKKYPIQASVANGKIQTTAILDPVNFVGGAGITIEMGINFDNTAAQTSSLSGLLDSPPAASTPDWWHPLDGQHTANASYDELLEKTADIIRRNDEISVNYGWKNWGDYQIGGSYHNPKNEKVEDWGSLQYDLGLGLLLAWAQTGDEYLWNRARAAVRNIMDIQIAKFEPYSQKRSGGGLRKGACPADNSHWCQEPIPEFNYHSRSLLLYSHLTGEAWPKEVAHMVIDNSAYFAATRQPFLMKSPRSLAWTLRNLYYGAKVFPQGTKYNKAIETGFGTMPAGTQYSVLLNELLDAYVTEVEKAGRLPNDQPVWAAQIVEGMIMAVESGLLEAPLETRTRAAIITAMDYFVKNELRSDGKGGYEMMYFVPNQQWANAATYGWFWLNNLMWTTINTPKDYSSTYTNMYNWLHGQYKNNAGYQTTRAWSGVIGFPGYFVNNYGN